MDRFDEKKHDRIEDAPEDRDRPAREGDILGLGGSTVPKAPGDPSASTDPAAAAQRRARRRDGEAADAAERGSDDTFGSTSIDMGAGGTGNTVTRK